jgi:hypothetical protein
VGLTQKRRLIVSEVEFEESRAMNLLFLSHNGILATPKNNPTFTHNTDAKNPHHGDQQSLGDFAQQKESFE